MTHRYDPSDRDHPSHYATDDEDEQQHWRLPQARHPLSASYTSQPQRRSSVDSDSSTATAPTSHVAVDLQESKLSTTTAGTKVVVGSSRHSRGGTRGSPTPPKKQIQIMSVSSDGTVSSLEGSVAETATGAAHFIGSGTSAGVSASASAGRTMEEDDSGSVGSPRGRVSGGSAALRRAATVATKGRASASASKNAPSGRQGAKVRRSNTTDALPVASRTSGAARHVSPKRVGSSDMRTSARMPRSGSMDHSAGAAGTTAKGSDRFKRQATGTQKGSLTTGTKSNTNLLDDDSDLSDPDEAYDKHSSLTGGPPSGSPVPISAVFHPNLSPTQPARGAVSLGSLPSGMTQSIHQSATRPSQGDSDDSGGPGFDWDDPMAPPSMLQQDFSLGTVDMNRDPPTYRPSEGGIPTLDRVQSVTLGGAQPQNSPSNQPSPATPQQPQGFFARLFGQRPTTTTLGSTTLAGFGKKYQVDQSVNLMDMEHATKLHSPYQPQQRDRKKSVMNTMFGGSMSGFGTIDLGGGSDHHPHGMSFEQHQKRRRTFKPHAKKQSSFCSKLRACLCGWGALLICVALAGAVALVLSLVYDGSTTTAKPPNPAPEPTTTTPEPTIKATPEPTQGPTENEKDEASESEETNAEFTSGAAVTSEIQETGKEQSEGTTAHLSGAAQDRWDDLVGLITRNYLTPKEEFDDPTSSAYKALDWMIEYESVMDFVASDDTNQLLENYALMVFYFATHPNAKPRDAHSGIWTPPTLAITKSAATFDSNKDWLHHAATPVCHREGVQCGHLKRVVILNLTRHDLKGTLPEELVALEHLIDLDLSHNEIEGTLPAIYAQMDHLQLINMKDNLLEGKFPDEWAALASLETLDLSQNPKLEDVPEL